MLSLLLALAPVLSQDSAASPAALERIPVLLVTGASNHDWEWTSESLATILRDTGRFDVTITRTPAKDLADAAAIARYRAFVLDYNGPRWGEPAETNFVAAVRNGTGVSVIHASDNAFPGWKEYEEIVGLLWREGTGHGKFHPFDVHLVDFEHPITEGLDHLRAHPDELYHRLVNVRDVRVRVLARAISTPESGGTGDDEPMVIVSAFGQGRVFHTPLGHVWKGDEASRASHLDPQFRRLVERGTQWAATGQVRDGKPLSLFNGVDLSGWEALGDAKFRVDDGFILGEVGGGTQSFLITKRNYGDFVLDVDLKNELPGNSGIQVRSHVNEQGCLYGYQIEIDPSERRFSGGLYDEARRGWLDDLSDNEAGRKAFRPGEWNHYRIACLGPSIRAWVNGVQTADYVDAMDLDGVIGLQVHSGNDTRVRWKNLTLEDFGCRTWQPLGPGSVEQHVHSAKEQGSWHLGPQDCDGESFALRLQFPSVAERLVVVLQTPQSSSSLAGPTKILGPGCVDDGLGLRFNACDEAFRSNLIATGWNDLTLIVNSGRMVAELNGKRVSEASYPRTRMTLYVLMDCSETLSQDMVPRNLQLMSDAK
jgi:uncharacterized protein